MPVRSAKRRSVSSFRYFSSGIVTVVPVGVFVGNLILQLAADVIIPVCFAGEAVIVIVVAGLHALGHLGSGQSRG